MVNIACVSSSTLKMKVKAECIELWDIVLHAVCMVVSNIVGHPGNQHW